MEFKCTKSAANWFDEISIFNVKINSSNGPQKDQNIYNFQQLEREIRDYIGQVKLTAILKSDEYEELYHINKTIFELIDLLRAEKVKSPVNYELLSEYGVKIDNKNTDRFIAKNNLQKKFFNTEIKEVKIG